MNRVVALVGGALALGCVAAPVVGPATLRAQPAAADQPPQRELREAEQPAGVAEPGHLGRVIATTTAGLGLRLTRNVDFDQGALAPFYVQARGGYAFPAAGAYHHGLSLGVSFNLNADGGYTEPVGPLQQWLLAPAYLGFLELGPDFFGLAHVGVPIALSHTKSVGLQLGAGAAYRLLAGFGLYTELSFAAFIGASRTLHPLFCWELGLSLDYEVLP